MQITKPMKQPKAKSSVIYQGPSLIDGASIVCIAIVKSSNGKTGDMLQTYIIRSDISPMTASKTGADYSICGDCVHRGKAAEGDNKQALERTCYVNLYHGPSQVFKGLQRGIYPNASPEDIATLGSGRMVRLGTYGDPAAIPQHIWDNLLSNAIGHTGYTHQHQGKAKPNYAQMMYSADNASEAKQAQAKGFRTFRVIPVKEYKQALSTGHTALLNSEILCPASKEMDYRTTCDNCKLCSGNTIKAKSIAIVAHGTSKAKVK